MRTDRPWLKCRYIRHFYFRFVSSTRWWHQDSVWCQTNSPSTASNCINFSSLQPPTHTLLTSRVCPAREHSNWLLVQCRRVCIGSGRPVSQPLYSEASEHRHAAVTAAEQPRNVYSWNLLIKIVAVRCMFDSYYLLVWPAVKSYAIA